MNTEEAFTPEQVTEVVGALHNATMDKWLGAGLTLVIGAVVIKIVMQALNRLVAKLPLDKAMLSFLTAAARIVMVIVLVTMVAGQLDVPITSLVAAAEFIRAGRFALRAGCAGERGQRHGDSARQAVCRGQFHQHGGRREGTVNASG